MKHEAILAETKEVASGSVTLEGQKVLESTLTGGSVNPLLKGAVREIAIPVNGSGPARDDGQAGVTIVRSSCDQRPVLVERAKQLRARVVTNSIRDAVSNPGANRVTIVQASDGRGDQAFSREFVTSGDADLPEPSLVEHDLLVGITVREVVLRQMSEGVRKVRESIAVGGRSEPGSEGVVLGASKAPSVRSWSDRPFILATAKGLLELLRGCRRVVIVDCVVRVAGRGVGGDSLDDITVAVVSELNEESGSGRHASVDVGRPSHVSLEVSRPEAEQFASRLVHSSRQVDVIDLSAEVGLACTKEQTTSHPVNVSVLQEVGGGRPFGSPAAEPNHLLTTGEVVDHSSGSVTGEGTTWTVLRNFPGGGPVGDSGRVVVHILSTHGGSRLNVCGGETSSIGDADQLLNVGTAAANTLRSGGGAERWLRVGINTDEANAKRELVGVNFGVLLGADTAVPFTAIVFVSEFAEGEDAAVFALGPRGIEGWKLEVLFRNAYDLVRDAVSIKAGSNRVSVVTLSNEDEDG